MALVSAGNESRFLFEISGVSSEFLVIEFFARERLSVPYEVELWLACEDEVKFDDVMGKEAVLTVLGEDMERHFHGVVNRFVHSEKVGRFHVYRAAVVPTLWLLCLERDCRIFQNKSVPDIVKTVLEEGPPPPSLSRVHGSGDRAGPGSTRCRQPGPGRAGAGPV